LILGVAIAFGYLITFFVAPRSRSCGTSVERFGQGDLSVRMNSRRKDEFGDLARAFDQMAERNPKHAHR